MKNETFNLSRILFSGVILVLTIFIVKPGKSQDQPAKDEKNMMKIKMVKTKDGKTTVIDTVITSNSPILQEEIDAFGWTDSSDQDSLMNSIEKMVVISRDGKGGKFNMKCCPQGFNYNFDTDVRGNCIPECAMEWDGFDGNIFDMRVPKAHARVFRYDNEQDGSLNELLGNIPLERVKSFSIKQRKNGKRIIIDVENGSVFESGNRTIIIRDGSSKARMQKRHGKPDQDVRVIIKTDQEEKDDKKEASPDPKI